MIKREYFTQKDGEEVVLVYRTDIPIELACAFVSREDEELINKYEWNIHAIHENRYIDTMHGVFHRMAFGSSVAKDLVLDHINLCKFDNIRNNLRSKTRVQNLQNVFRRQYINNGKDFRVRIKVDPQVIPEDFVECDLIQEVDYRNGVIYGVSYTCEADACKAAYILENLYKKYNPEYNPFDIVSYRRDDFRNLLLERTGKLAKDEADLRHIFSYRNNAWYIMRYGLEGIYKDFNIKIPEYSFDENGFMIDRSSGSKLCPYRCDTRNGVIKYTPKYKNTEVKEQLSIDSYLSILDMCKKHFYVGTMNDFVDEELLFTEASSFFAEYKALGYTNRAALKFVENNYTRLIKGDVLNKVLDRILDNALDERVNAYKRREEERIVVSFFKNFCEVTFNTDQFLTEFYSFVTDKKRVGFHHRAALIFTIEEYLQIYRLDKLSLFISYFRNYKDMRIYEDLYGNALDIANLWRGIKICVSRDSCVVLINCQSNQCKLISSIDFLPSEVISSHILEEQLSLDECYNIKHYEKNIQVLRSKLLQIDD